MIGIIVALAISNSLTFLLTCRYISKSTRTRKHSEAIANASNVDNTHLEMLKESVAREKEINLKCEGLLNDLNILTTANKKLTLSLTESEQNREMLVTELNRVIMLCPENELTLKRLSGDNINIQGATKDRVDISNENVESLDESNFSQSLPSTDLKEFKKFPPLRLNTAKQLPTVMKKITGKELLDKIRSLDSNLPNEQLARACGYVGHGRRLQMNSFYKALLEAKEVENNQEDVQVNDVLPTFITESGQDLITARDWYENRIDGLPGDDYIARCTRLVDWWIALPGVNHEAIELFANFADTHEQEINECRSNENAQTDIDDLVSFIENNYQVTVEDFAWNSILKSVVEVAVEGLIDINIDIAGNADTEDLKTHFGIMVDFWKFFYAKGLELTEGDVVEQTSKNYAATDNEPSLGFNIFNDERKEDLGLVTNVGKHSIDAPKDNAFLSLESGNLIYVGSKGLQAHGQWLEKNRFIVLMGSECNANETSSCRDSIKELRKTLISGNILARMEGKLVFLRDHAFTSPSQASSVIYGGSSNGRTSWADSNGKDLNELQKADSFLVGRDIHLRIPVDETMNGSLTLNQRVAAHYDSCLDVNSSWVNFTNELACLNTLGFLQKEHYVFVVDLLMEFFFEDETYDDLMEAVGDYLKSVKVADPSLIYSHNLERIRQRTGANPVVVAMAARDAGVTLSEIVEFEEALHSHQHARMFALRILDWRIQSVPDRINTPAEIDELVPLIERAGKCLKLKDYSDFHIALNGIATTLGYDEEEEDCLLDTLELFFKHEYGNDRLNALTDQECGINSNSETKESSSMFGFRSFEDIRTTLEQHGRAILGVVADGDEHVSYNTKWVYSIPLPDGQEPTLLTSYPGETSKWLLNKLGDAFRNGELSLPEADETVEVDGYLGINGELPIRITALNAARSAFAYAKFTCQSWDKLPVALVTLPDPTGCWPEDLVCDPRVSVPQRAIYSAFFDGEIGSQIPLDKLNDALLTIANRENVQEQVDRAKKALAERDFSTYWNTVFGIVALIGGADGDGENEDDYIDMVNRELGGPGT